VTLTAAPPAGLNFVNWTGSGAGSCSLSTAPTCNVTVTTNTSVQANFK
jgi:List-Bact-rpt repeat protein